MNRDMIRRLMARDYARGRNRGNQNYDSRYNSDYAMNQNRDYREIPQMYSNEYAMGKHVYDGNTRNRFTPRRFDSRDMNYNESDYARMDYMYSSDMPYDGKHIYPFEIAGRVGREYYPDYSSNSKLTEQELNEWAMRLTHSVEEKDKQALSKEQIIRKAGELGISFDKFKESEFYVTVLMMYTDYCKTLGTANFDIYLRLAKDWLCDEDVAVKYGEKLAMYHDSIVEGM